MASENTKPRRPQDPGSTSENRGAPPRPRPGGRPTALAGLYAAVLDDYAAALAGAPIAPESRRTYLSKVRQYLAWLAGAAVDGDPLTTSAARDWAVRDYRTHLQAVAKRAPRTVNNALAAVDDFYTRRGLGAANATRADLPKSAPRALSTRTAVRFLRAVEQRPSPRPGPRPDPVLRRRPHRRDRRPGRRRRQDLRPQGHPSHPRQGRKGPRGPPPPGAARRTRRLASRTRRLARRARGGTVPQPTRRPALGPRRRRHHHRHRHRCPPRRRRRLCAPPAPHLRHHTRPRRHRPGDRRRAGRARPPGDHQGVQPAHRRGQDQSPEPAHHRPVTK